ncbi:hypothetical protein, partial [Carnobacterium maltaromaticum]
RLNKLLLQGVFMMTEEKELCMDDLKMDLAKALAAHVDILKNVDQIEPDQIDGLAFVMRSLGFMLEKTPCLLLRDNDEDVYYAMFQYYSLLEELKHNVKMSYPHARIHTKLLIDILEGFPKTYSRDMIKWWELKTGLVVEHTKQTILMD